MNDIYDQDPPRGFSLWLAWRLLYTSARAYGWRGVLRGLLWAHYALASGWAGWALRLLSSGN